VLHVGFPKMGEVTPKWRVTMSARKEDDGRVSKELVAAQ